jgi:cobalt/nickel transport system permease protein
MMPLALHLPDGFMSMSLAALGWVLVLPALFWALSQSRDEDDHETTLAALLAACIFAAQTFHFPVPGGTSGHLVGGTLVVILCGPATGLLVLASVVVLQALVFGDGGLFTMGWNLANMGLVGGVVGGALYSILRRVQVRMFCAAFLSAWVATMLAALCTGMELAAAGITPLPLSLTAMLSVQSLVGIGEGLVTAGTVVFLSRTRPHLMEFEPAFTVVPGVVIALAVGVATLAPPEWLGLGTGQYPAAAVYFCLCVALSLVSVLLALWSRR